jgi:hypothetical protein
MSGRGHLIAEGPQVGEKPNTFRSKAPTRFLSNQVAADCGGGRLKTAEASNGEPRSS